MDPVQGTAPVFVPAHTVIGAESLMALVYAHMFMDARQLTIDNQTNARAWNNLALRQAKNAETVDHRVDQNGTTVDHLADTGSLASEQTGQTENQAAVDPIRTGTGDDIADDKASSLSAIDVAKIAGAVAGAGEAVNADSTNANNLSVQAAALINGLAKMYGLQVSIVPAGTQPAA